MAETSNKDIKPGEPSTDPTDSLTSKTATQGGPSHPPDDQVAPSAKQSFAELEQTEKYKENLLSFDQRHVLALSPASSWAEKDEKLQTRYNRILQEGVSTLTPGEIIKISRVTKEDWITDFVPLKIESACILNIAADLVTKYSISPEALNKKTHQVYKAIIVQNSAFLKNIEDKVSAKLVDSGYKKELDDKASKNFQKKYPDMEDSDSDFAPYRQLFVKLEEAKARKSLMSEFLKNELDSACQEVYLDQGLDFKTLYEPTKNHDYSFLGAAGSGKSTISKQFFAEGKKEDCVSLATDDYRGVSLTENPEIDDEQGQVFIKTQDTAYLIKELVQARLEAAESRPNVILDCVSLEGWHRKLIANSAEVTSAVACLNDIGLVPTRAYLRALDETSGPADKGRQANTTALLEGHALASARLLTSIPNGMRTTLYDTNIPRGKPPSIMAIIDTSNKNHNVEVMNLSKFASFLGKANANSEADFRGALYKDSKREKYQYTYDVHYQAQQLLKLVEATPPFKPDSYELLIKQGEGVIEYAKVMVDENGGLSLKVLNAEDFLSILNKNNDDSKILKSLAIQIYSKTFDQARENIEKLGLDGAVNEAIRHLVPGVEPVIGRKKEDPYFRLATQSHLKKSSSHKIKSNEFRREIDKAKLKAKLNAKLESAFRTGAVNSRFPELHREGVADHLPVTMHVEPQNGGSGIDVATWNLLANAHLKNIFLNVSAVKYFEKGAFSLGGSGDTGKNAFEGRGHHLFSYIAEHFYKADGNEVVITRESIDKFLNGYPFKNDNERADARIVCEALMKPEHLEEFSSAIKHSIEIQHGISEKTPGAKDKDGTQGYLRWENRFKMIQENIGLVKELSSKDFICLQECTNPEQMLGLLNSNVPGKYDILIHKVSDKTDDHCVIIYDATKYVCVGEPDKFGLNNNTKPCLMATFKGAGAGSGEGQSEPFIVGSIHHPGGEAHNEMDVIMQHKDKLRGDNTAMPCHILGDFNHPKEHFDFSLPKGQDFRLATPETGTLAGSDYGNTNKAIDGVLTNRASDVSMKVYNEFKPPLRVELPFQVSVDIKSFASNSNAAPSADSMVKVDTRSLDADFVKLKKAMIEACASAKPARPPPNTHSGAPLLSMFSQGRNQQTGFGAQEAKLIKAKSPEELVKAWENIATNGAVKLDNTNQVLFKKVNGSVSVEQDKNESSTINTPRIG